MKKNEIKSAPVFPNSIMRKIFIDKREYYLIYNHEKIPSSEEREALNITDVDLGNIKIIEKFKADKPLEEEYKVYSSEGNILGSTSINQNLLQNDKLLIQKIALTLEGKYSEGKERFLLNEEERKFKICIKVQAGINLVMFACPLIIETVKDYNDIMPLFMDSFQLKYELKVSFQDKYNQIEKDIDNENLELIKLKDRINPKEGKILQAFADKLNEKKKELVELKKTIDPGFKGGEFNENQGDINMNDDNNEDDKDQSNKDNNLFNLGLGDNELNDPFRLLDSPDKNKKKSKKKDGDDNNSLSDL